MRKKKGKIEHKQDRFFLIIVSSCMLVFSIVPFYCNIFSHAIFLFQLFNCNVKSALNEHVNAMTMY